MVEPVSLLLATVAGGATLLGWWVLDPGGRRRARHRLRVVVPLVRRDDPEAGALGALGALGASGTREAPDSRGAHRDRARPARPARSARRDVPSPRDQEGEAVVALDLLAALLASGAVVPVALEAVAAALPEGGVARALRSSAALLHLGAPVQDAARELDGLEALQGLARAWSRSASSGAPLAAALERLAADARSEQRWRAEARVRKVGTKAALPLALCFLPAFVLVGVVPLVVDVGQELLAP